MFCRSLFVVLTFFLVAIVLSVIWITDSNYPFGILKLFLKCKSPLSCNWSPPVLEMKISIYCSESNSWTYFGVVLNKNWKIYWSEQNFTGFGLEDWCSSWGLHLNQENHCLSTVGSYYLQQTTEQSLCPPCQIYHICSHLTKSWNEMFVIL